MNVTIDTTVAQKKAQNAKRSLGERFEAMGNLAARVAAYHMHQYTLPVSRSDQAWPFKKMGERIEADVKSVYWSKEDDGWQWGAYELIEDSKGKEAADEWWSKYRSGNQSGFDPENPEKLDYEDEFDRMRRGIPRSINESRYQSLRKRHNGQMPRRGSNDYEALGFVKQNTRNNFIKKRKRRMGLAKAGWFAVFLGLAHKNTIKVTGGKSEHANRRFPREIRKPFNLFGGLSLGAANILGTEKGYKFMIHNKVRYADEAIPETLFDKALAVTKRYIEIQLDQQLKHGKLWRGGTR